MRWLRIVEMSDHRSSSRYSVQRKRAAAAQPGSSNRWGRCYFPFLSSPFGVADLSAAAAPPLPPLLLLLFAAGALAFAFALALAAGALALALGAAAEAA